MNYTKKALIAVLLLTPMLHACTTIASYVLEEQKQADAFTANDLALIIESGESFELQQFAEAVQAAKELQPHSERLIVLIHGMGPYPQKAFEHKEIASVIESYNAAVVMLHWPSWNGSWNTLTRKNAFKAGRMLGTLWQAVDEEQKKRHDTTFILMAHSMGAELLRTASELPHKTVFTLTFLAAPETDVEGHAAWLNKLHLGKKRVVLSNEDDNVLPYAQAVAKKPRLGLTLKNTQGEAERLAKNTYYIYLQGITRWHSAYASKQSPEMLAILRQIVDDTSSGKDIDSSNWLKGITVLQR